MERPDAAFSGGRVRVRVTANGRAAMGESWGSPLLLAEAIAQAALLLGGDGADPEASRRGFLAGIEGFSAERAPRAGETLEVRVRLAARFGAAVRFDGEVWSEGETIARGAVLVRRGSPAPAAPAATDGDPA